jgi:sugar O-acyltransferase (sialic acid O-acetyltransferase NeuD family)
MDVVVYGASEHGKYTIDILEKAGTHRVVGLLDDAAAVGTTVLGYPVLGSGADLVALRRLYGFGGGVVAIGDNHLRSRVVARIREVDPGFEFVAAVHPFTSIGSETTIGAGSVLMAGAIVNGSSRVGEHCFIATKASLDHDSVMEDFSSLSPGVSTGGQVRIGGWSTVSIGASVLHGRTIGQHTVIGAGSTVTSDMPSHVVAYGTPCRVVRSRSEGDRYL